MSLTFTQIYIGLNNFLQKINNTQNLSVENFGSFGKEESLVERVLSLSVGMKF